MTSIAWIKTALWLLLASPLLWLGYLISIDLRAPTTALGADPGEAVVHFLGAWALRMLLLGFSVSPLYKLTRLTWLARSRRLFGLWAFTYVVLHFTSYLYFYLEFDVQALLDDLVERTYITAGMLAAVLLGLMAATSTRGWRQRLGRRWQQLHRAIYPAIAAAIAHFLWFTRDQYGEVVLYATWFVLLIGLRVYFRRQAEARRSRTA